MSPRTKLLLTLAAAVCACTEPQGPELPPSGNETAQVELQLDVEALVSRSLAGWWRAAHGWWPGPALSTAADAHTSSWRNWGMLDAGAEPRQALNTDPEYDHNFTFAPWEELNRTLASVRDGLKAIEGGVELGEDGADTDRAVAFGTFTQGMALGTLAQLYSQAFIVDENTDVSSVQASSYSEVMEAALAKLGEAIALCEAGTFTLPAEWVGFAAPMDQDDLARLARSYRARFRISVARTPEERAAVDWNAVLEDVRQGITEDWVGHWNGDWETNWAWASDKLYAGSQPIWGRLDYRTIGPADASGAWQTWLATPPWERQPFLIDTDDRRITGGSPMEAGLYVDFDPDIWFRPERGRDHFSYYTDTRWAHLFDTDGVGDYPDFPVKELALLEAEALYRTGDRAGAMALVNASRDAGELPHFTSPSGVAPGGARCVPKTSTGACGDLWEALKYEKRIELFHYGPFTEFLDDRGWGDLVWGTFKEFPAPGIGFAPLLSELYGVSGQTSAAALADDTSAEGIRMKREAFDTFDEVHNSHPGDVGAG